MKTDEIRGLADGDVKVRIAALEEERFRLRFRSGTEALEEPLRLRSIRRDIARLQTILRERVLGLKRGVSAPARAATKTTATKAAAKKATPKARGR